MSRKPIPEELLTEKQLKDKLCRKNNREYNKKYSRYYYLKKILEDPNYNKNRRKREVFLKTKRELELKASKLNIKDSSE